MFIGRHVPNAVAELETVDQQLNVHSPFPSHVPEENPGVSDSGVVAPARFSLGRVRETMVRKQ